MCIPKIFLCKYENQNKPNGASPPIPSLGIDMIFFYRLKIKIKKENSYIWHFFI